MARRRPPFRALPRVMPLLLCTCLLLVSAPPPLEARHRQPPEVEGEAVALIDADSGRLLHGRRADEPLPMASTTKLMTALLLAEATEPADTIWIPYEARGTPGGKLYLEPGTRYTAADMIEALILASANDAAVAAAVNVGGDVPDFVAMMNRRAGRMGLEHTSFANPHGLDAPGHRASAADLAALGRRVLEVPAIRRAAARRAATIAAPARGGTLELRTHNRFLTLYRGAVGIKTGYTDDAGFCLVAAAERDGARLVGVILGGTDGDAVAREMARLMDWAFAAFAPRTLVKRGQWVTLGTEAGDVRPRTRRVRAGGTVRALLPREQPSAAGAVGASLRGDRLQVSYGGRAVGSVPVAVAPAAEAADGSVASRDEGWLRGSARRLAGWGAVVAAALVAWAVRRRRRARHRYRWRVLQSSLWLRR